MLYHGSPVQVSIFQSSPGSSARGPGSPSQGSPRYVPTSPAYTARDFNQQNYTFPSSPQHSFTSGSHSGNSSGPPSRRFPCGESSSHSSPAGVLQFQQRQYQQHSPHHSPDHQNLSGSPLYRKPPSDTGKPPSDGLLPLPQMDTRGFYAGNATRGHFAGRGNAGNTGAGIIPGLPRVAGFGQQHHTGVGAPTWPAQNPIFPPGQIFATDQLFAGEYEVEVMSGCSVKKWSRFDAKCISTTVLLPALVSFLFRLITTMLCSSSQVVFGHLGIVIINRATRFRSFFRSSIAGGVEQTTANWQGSLSVSEVAYSTTNQVFL